MCAPRDTPIAVTLDRQEWGDVASAIDLLPHPPAQDPPGVTRLLTKLGELGLIPPDLS